MDATRRSVWLHPTRLIIVVYVGIAAVGSLLLALPVATPAGSPRIAVETAVFTATSALSVTGLAVVDTATEWSRFGQAVILGLIQLGGFGITTFASVFAVLVFRRLGLRARLATQLEQNQQSLGSLGPLIKRIAVFYLLAEVTGAVVLTMAFWDVSGGDPLEAIWTGLFHSVSAFNNAGFSTFSDNLIGFASDPLVLVPMMLLVVLGGIGFPVVLEVVRNRRWRTWSIHTKLTLSTTAVLLVVGTAAYVLLDWSNAATLGAVSDGPGRVIDALFMSAATRTAGFSTFDFAGAGSGAEFITMVLMFIGGGSASTAGGIKVTTFALLAFVIVAELRANPDVNVFGRRISEATQRQAVGVALLGLGSVAIGTLAVAATSPSIALGDVLFEVVSAVGTVGLSTGVTPDLEPLSQWIVSGLMLLGRLGPVTFGTALVLRQRRYLLRYPEGRPLIG